MTFLTRLGLNKDDSIKVIVFTLKKKKGASTPCMFSDMYPFSLDSCTSEDQIAIVIEKYVSNKPFALPADLIVRQMHLEDFEIW